MEQQSNMSRHVGRLVEEELAKISDQALLDVFRPLLVPPQPVERGWDYGTPDQKFVCWTVIEHAPSNTGIAYCDSGFGPANPWGLVFLSGEHMSIGMDCGWYTRLEDAMRESCAWDGPNLPGYEVL